MRNRLLLVSAAALLFVAPSLVSLSAGQAQQPAPAGAQAPGGRAGTPSVQVGVPEGRGGAPARQGGAGRQAGPARPAPRRPDGRVFLGGATPAEKGVWLPGGGGAANLGDSKEVPFQPWARALLADRDINQLEPHTRCKPSGTVRQFLTPYGVEIVELPELQRIYIFDIGGPHTYRTIYMDGRSHPHNEAPSHYGHSIGWWEGDTLVIDTTAFNEGFWIDRRGAPHTEKMHTVERLTRKDAATMGYQLTIDDPGAYTAVWTRGMDLRWEPGTELFEYQCQQANYAHELMVGGGDKVDRASPIVP